MARIVPRLTRGLMSSASAPRSSGAIGGVDPRIFSGIDGFVGKEQMSRVNEWQAGLWQRLADEVRSECIRWLCERDADACALIPSLPIDRRSRTPAFRCLPTADV